RSVDLQLGAIEIHRAEIVLYRRGFGILQKHRESRAAPTGASPSDGGLMPLLVAESGRIVVFSVQQHLPHLREDAGNLRRFEGPFVWREEALVPEDDLLGVGVARRLNGHRTVAGDEKGIVSGGYA